MTQVMNFKAGDKVYYPSATNKVLQVTSDLRVYYVSAEAVVDDELLKQYANKEILIYVYDTVKKAFYSVDDSPDIDDDGKEYQYSHWFSDEFGDFMWEFDEIKYWQPLPKPPTE